MSLTRELNKKQSPFRQLVEGCAPALAIAGGRSPEGKRVAEHLGFYDLVKARSLAPLPDGVTDARRHSPTVGMPFDIRTRMMLSQFEPRRSASAMGMDVFNHLLAPLLPNGQHISDVLGDAFLEAERLTRDGDDVDQDYASIVFAWCESIYRAGGQYAARWANAYRQRGTSTRCTTRSHHSCSKTSPGCASSTNGRSSTGTCA